MTQVPNSKRSTGLYAILDAQFGSCGKGLLAGYLAETRQPTAVVSAYSPNAGHTYITSDGFRFVTTQMPIGSISPRVRGIFIGPGAVINPKKMLEEISVLTNAGRLDLQLTEIVIHEHAAVVTEADAAEEAALGLAAIGSTLKGSMTAQVRKLRRMPNAKGELPVARDAMRGTPLEDFVAGNFEYQMKLQEYGYITQIEGAQGFSLSLNHGFYPYCTSRDVTPHQLFGDCAIPWDLAKRTEVYQVMRTYPIRVNNRTGTSGPGYADQHEIDWGKIGIDPELTTVTKLPRRVFTWSRQQLEHMVRICGTPDAIFLNFVNYVQDPNYLAQILEDIQQVTKRNGIVHWFGMGPGFEDVLDVDRLLEWRAGSKAEVINAATISTEGYRLDKGD